MSVIAQIRSLPGRVLKAFTMTFSTSAGWLGTTLNRTRYPYASQVDPLRNSVVVAVVNWIARNFPEAPALVRRQKQGQWETVPEHPLAALLRRPNPFHSGTLLFMALVSDFVTSGNGYLLKVRSTAGRVVQLWWAPSNLVEPKDSTPDGTGFITHYDYSPRGIPVRLEPSEVVHFRLGLDPQNPRKGLSPLSALMREIFTDDEAANFTASLLRNLGVPGVIVAPKDGGMVATQEDLESVKSKFRETFGGDNRGDVMLMTAPTDVHVLSFNPQQMDLKALRSIPEERISGVFGVAAIVAGLGAGLARSTFANYASAREASYEENIIPMQRIIADTLTTQLLVDFERTLEGVEVFFDLSKVRVLLDDEDKLSARLVAQFQGGVIMRAEARRRLGLEATPEDDVYAVPMSTILTGPGAPEEPPLPAPVKAAGNGQGAADYSALFPALRTKQHVGPGGPHVGHGGSGASWSAGAASLREGLPEAVLSDIGRASAIKKVDVVDAAEMSKRGGLPAGQGAGFYEEGTGTILVLDTGNPAAMRATLAHEVAHGMDPIGADGRFTVSESAEWMKAAGWRRDAKGSYKLTGSIENRPVSPYGEKSPWEDFAETYRVFTTGSDFDRRVMAGESEKRLAFMQKLQQRERSVA